MAKRTYLSIPARDPRYPISLQAKRVSKHHNEMIRVLGTTGQAAEYDPATGHLIHLKAEGYSGPYTKGSTVILLKGKLTQREAQLFLELDGFGKPEEAQS
ncbi:MAG: hypothetical protein ACOH1Y_14870 [Propionicimonas sp.]